MKGYHLSTEDTRMGHLFCQIEFEPQTRSKEQIIYQHKKTRMEAVYYPG